MLQNSGWRCIFAVTFVGVASVYIWQRTPSNTFITPSNTSFADSSHRAVALAHISSNPPLMQAQATPPPPPTNAISALVAQVSKEFDENPDTSRYWQQYVSAKVNGRGFTKRVQGTASIGWRTALIAIRPAVEAMGFPLHSGPAEIYEFGVLKGLSLRLIRKIYPSARLIGFDSFQGLPEEDKSVARVRTWSKGRYNGGDVRASLTKDLGGPDRAKFAKGFYSDSLTPELPQTLELKPAWYIDVDCDLYISTVQALDWMFSHGLVQVGTLIGYDDWWALRFWGKSAQPLSDGEGRAHVEMAAPPEAPIISKRGDPFLLSWLWGSKIMIMAFTSHKTKLTVGLMGNDLRVIDIDRDISPSNGTTFLVFFLRAFQKISQ